MVGFGLVIVEKVSCSCRVSSGEKSRVIFWNSSVDMIFVITCNISIIEEKRLLMKEFVMFFDRSFKFSLKRGDSVE